VAGEDSGSKLQKAQDLKIKILTEKEDAAESVMPQTRFVLSKALAAKLKPIVVINKIDTVTLQLIFLLPFVSA